MTPEEFANNFVERIVNEVLDEFISAGNLTPSFAEIDAALITRIDCAYQRITKLVSIYRGVQ